MLRRVTAGLALLLALGGLALLLGEDEEASSEGEVFVAKRKAQTTQSPPRVTFDPNPAAPDGGAPSAAAATDALPNEGETSDTTANVLAVSAPAGDDPGGSSEAIRGVVTDPDGAPIYGAVILEVDGGQGAAKSRRAGLGRRTSSDAQGFFVLDRVPPGGRILVRARGFASRVLPLGRKPGGVVKVELLPTRRVSVLVIEAETGLPIAKAQVRVQTGSKRSRRETDEAGALALAVSTKSVTLEVWAKERVARIWRDGDPSTIPLDRGRSVRGEVVLPAGGRAANAPVIVVGRGQRRWPQRTRTDGEGRFELLGGISPGEQLAVFSWDQVNATPLRYDWLPAGSDDVVVRLARRGLVEVFGGGGPEGTLLRPVPVLRMLARANGSRPIRWAGHATYPGLAAGAYQMRSLEGEAYGERFKVEPGHVTRVEWRPTPEERRAKEARRLSRAAGARRIDDAAKAGEAASATRRDAASSRTQLDLEAKVEPRQPVDVRVLRGGRRIRSLHAPGGVFRLSGLQPGDYTLEIKRRDGQAFLLDLTLPLPDPLTIPIGDEE